MVAPKGGGSLFRKWQVFAPQYLSTVLWVLCICATLLVLCNVVQTSCSVLSHSMLSFGLRATKPEMIISRPRQSSFFCLMVLRMTSPSRVFHHVPDGRLFPCTPLSPTYSVNPLNFFFYYYYYYYYYYHYYYCSTTILLRTPSHAFLQAQMHCSPIRSSRRPHDPRSHNVTPSPRCKQGS
jgi:hypothetical protein